MCRGGLKIGSMVNYQLICLVLEPIWTLLSNHVWSLLQSTKDIPIWDQVENRKSGLSSISIYMLSRCLEVNIGAANVCCSIYPRVAVVVPWSVWSYHHHWQCWMVFYCQSHDHCFALFHHYWYNHVWHFLNNSFVLEVVNLPLNQGGNIFPEQN